MLKASRGKIQKHYTLKEINYTTKVNMKKPLLFLKNLWKNNQNYLKQESILATVI